MRSFIIIFLVLAIAAPANAMNSKLVFKTLVSEYSNNGDIHAVAASIRDDVIVSLEDGTGANKANQCWADERSLNASSSEEIDLAGNLSNAFGQTLTFSKVKAVVIKASASNASDVEMGGAAANAFASFVKDSSDIILIKPGGLIVLIAPDASGFDVSSNDLLKMANSGGAAISYEIIVIGEATVS
mgnify:CR=1 FL=1